MTDTCLLSDTCIKSGSCYAKDRASCLEAATCRVRLFQSSVVVSMRRQKSEALSNRESYVCTEENCEKASYSKSDEDVDNDDQKEWWSKTTNDLVQLSTFPFLFLSLPQLRTNAIHLRNGNLLALSVLSWKVPVSLPAAVNVLRECMDSRVS